MASESVKQDSKHQSETDGEPISMVDAVDMGSAVLTTAQVASYLNVSQPTVLRMIKVEGLPAINLQRRYRIPRGQFAEWLRHQAVSNSDG